MACTLHARTSAWSCGAAFGDGAIRKTRSVTDGTERPYAALVSELGTIVVELLKVVERRQRSVRSLPGAYIASFDLASLSLTVCKAVGDQTVVIERIAADPRDSQTFGASLLPLERAQRSAS